MLRLHAFIAGGPDFIPSKGTKILQATRSGRKGGRSNQLLQLLTQNMWAFFPTPNNSPPFQTPTGYPVMQLHSDTMAQNQPQTNRFKSSVSRDCSHFNCQSQLEGDGHPWDEGNLASSSTRHLLSPQNTHPRTPSSMKIKPVTSSLAKGAEKVCSLV